MVQQVVVDFLEPAVEFPEDVLVVHTVECAASLSDGVHAEHPTTDVNGLDACAWG